MLRYPYLLSLLHISFLGNLCSALVLYVYLGSLISIVPLGFFIWHLRDLGKDSKPRCLWLTHWFSNKRIVFCDFTWIFSYLIFLLCLLFFPYKFRARIIIVIECVWRLMYKIDTHCSPLGSLMNSISFFNRVISLNILLEIPRRVGWKHNTIQFWGIS